jgi:MFS family permease
MTDSTSKGTGSWGALERRNYRLFVAGQLVSLVGTWTQSLAQSWLVYRLTGSPLSLGLTTFCQQVPAFLFASLGGLLADRYRRRTLLLMTQGSAMALAFVLATLTLSGRVRIGHIFVLAALLGIVNAIDSPTRQSFVVEMVGRENLAGAVALNTSMVTGASFVGPAVAGVFITVFGEGWCFMVNGISFVAVIASLFAMRDLPLPMYVPGRESMWTRLAEGFRFAATHRDVRALLLLLTLTAMTGLPFGTLMPVFASTILHGDAQTLGLLMGAPGLGAVLVGILLASKKTRGSHRRTGGACAVFGVLLLAFSQMRTVWWSVAVLVPIGVATMVQLTATNAGIQAATPDALRGRVMAIWFMILSGFLPLGSLLSGFIATTLGPVVPFAIGGALCALGGTYFMWLFWSDEAQPPSPHPDLRR